MKSFSTIRILSHFLLCLKAPMGVDLVTLLDPVSRLAGLGEGGACPRGGAARELQVPQICLGSAGASPSGAMCLE